MKEYISQLTLSSFILRATVYGENTRQVVCGSKVLICSVEIFLIVTYSNCILAPSAKRLAKVLMVIM